MVTTAPTTVPYRRILLTSDRGLLKRRRVTHGLFVRAGTPVEQAVDVVRRLDLADRLEPLTRLYVDDFRRCRACGQVYWCGSHHERLNRIVDEIPAGI